MAIVDSNTIKTPSALNKYRGILIAVTLFLMFNLSVLGLNFYTSSTLDNDAISINLSGRQRMLSQRTVKALMTIQVDAAQGQFNEKIRPSSIKSLHYLTAHSLHLKQAVRYLEVMKSLLY